MSRFDVCTSCSAGQHQCTANGSHHCSCPLPQCETARIQNRRMIAPRLRARLLAPFLFQFVMTWGIQALVTLTVNLPWVVAAVSITFVLISFRNLSLVVRHA